MPDSTVCDALIVLGGGITRSGELTVVSRARVDRAIEMFRAGVAPHIIMTGKCGFFFDKPITEAAAMLHYARSHGIPDDAMLLEEDARDTLANAYFTRERYLEPNEWKSVCIVTSDFHVRRATALFRLVLGRGYTIHCAAVSTGFSRVELLLRMIERLKLSWFHRRRAARL